MSANNQIKIHKKMYTWSVDEVDVDTGFVNYHIGDTDDLEEAIRMAKRYEEEQLDEGYPIEYGLDIAVPDDF